MVPFLQKAMEMRLGSCEGAKIGLYLLTRLFVLKAGVI